MHLYTLVAVPFVAQLLLVDRKDPSVGLHASIIQAGFLIGWALGGGFFGRIGDRLGRSRALCLTILTYAIFTGMSFFAQNWWHLLIFRFLSALGIGGEWAVGASLLSETWPRRWRAWIAAVLQTGVNIGILLAVLSNFCLAGPVSATTPHSFPGRDTSGAVGIVDSASGPGTRRMAQREEACKGTCAETSRSISWRRAQNNYPGHYSVLSWTNRALGLYVLAPGSPAQPAGCRGLD